MFDQSGKKFSALIYRVVLFCILLATTVQSLFFSQVEGKKGDEDLRLKFFYDLVVWGQLKFVKGNEGFYDFSCTVQEEGRWKKQKVFVKLGDGLKVFVDRRVKFIEFKKDDKVYVLGKSCEDISVSPMGLSLIEYWIIAVQAVLKGKGIKINEDYCDRKDKLVRWLDILVEINDGQFKVTYFEQKGYRVEVDKRVLLIHRMSAEAELVISNTRGFYAFVLGKKSEDRFDIGKKLDKKKPVFSINRVIVLDLTALKLGLYQKLYN